jgi:glucose/arabinose dehydrogenase
MHKTSMSQRLLQPLRQTITASVLILLLAACAGGVAGTPAAATQPTAAAAQAASTVTPATTVTAAESPTEMPQPSTETTQPTETASSTASTTSQPTNTPEATETVTATAAAATAPAAAGLSNVKLKLEPVASGLSGPLWVTHADDDSGRLFVIEKPGTIRIIADGKLVEQPFLDIRDRVGSSSSEQGLLGLAFAPDYAQSGFFFVDYTDKQGDTVIARFKVSANADIADPASEFKVLGVDQPAPNHNGGDIVFGPDGMLWIGMGDGGAANDRFGNGQNPATLLGKLLRLDVTTDLSKPYTIPADNPWVSNDWNGQDVRDEVWAVGLRNPWRFSFDRQTGDLWIADVGQNTYEEVDHVKANADGRVQGGLNFGWPIMEGQHCFGKETCQREGLKIPVAEYNHTEGCSITGGYVYRGKSYPALTGAYLFADYCSGTIWGLQRIGNSWQRVELLSTSYNISSFGEDEAGELYVTDLDRGGVYRVVVE